MTHRKNRDLKAELGEAQFAAQAWEQKWAESQQLLSDVRGMRDAVERIYSDQIIELRNELGQASRELMAVSEQLDVCRKERGEALDALYEALDLMDEATDYVEGRSGNIVERCIAFERKHRPVTPEGDTSESEAMRKELDAMANQGVDPVLFAELMNRQSMHQMVGELGAAMGEVLEHEEEDPDLNEASEFEVTQP